MAIRNRTKIAKQSGDLAEELADRVYGKAKVKKDDLVVTSISIPRSMLHRLEDLALKNKRNGVEPKNTSALIRLAVDNLLTNN